MVYLAVSYVNECAYCATHHEQTARRAGLTDDDLRDLKFEINKNFNDKEQAALQFARELTRTASVGDDVRFRTGELFPGEQLVELTMIVALANFTNRFNNGLGVPLEQHPAQG
jgi:AhpD family alkylhydroperoxidase